MAMSPFFVCVVVLIVILSKATNQRLHKDLSNELNYQDHTNHLLSTALLPVFERIVERCDVASEIIRRETDQEDGESRGHNATILSTVFSQPDRSIS